MSFQSLDLETVTLADPNEKLTLAVKTKANLKVEETTLSPSNKVTFDALALGKFWVWSGTACCLEIEVLVDGQPLHQDSRLHFLEILGGQICDQDLWSSLSLSTTLRIPSQSHQSFFTVDINPAIISKATADLQPRPWDLPVVGCNPPIGVVRARLETVLIQFNFLTIDHRKSSLKRKKHSPWQLSSQIDSPLNSRFFDPEDCDPGKLVIAVKSLGNLSKTILEGFNQKPSHHELPVQPSTSHNRKFPIHTIDILKTWILSNPSKAQMDECDRVQLMQQTGLKRGQLNNSLLYYRRTLVAKGLLKKGGNVQGETSTGTGAPIPCRSVTIAEETLIPRENAVYEKESDNDDMLLDKSFEGMSNIEILSSRSSQTRPLLAQASANNLSCSRHTFSKRLLPVESLESGGQTILRLNTAVASQLGNHALRILIGGHLDDPRGKSKEIIRGSILPSKSLSKIAPTLFDPSFSHSIAQNSTLLSIISRSISTTILHNAQSPTLQKKLTALAEIPSLSQSSWLDSPTPDPSQSEKIASGIQHQLWATMQRSLFDQAALKRIWRTESDLKSTAEEDPFLDLLEETLFGQEIRAEEIDNFSDSDFEDLLQHKDEIAGSQNSLDVELLAIEKDTEEMLLGCMYVDEISEDEDLLDGGGEERVKSRTG